MRTVTIDPVTRIEGHLKIEAVIDEGEVKEARSTGTLFRGIELILQGRDPRDAARITQRICGVCPTSHATASTFALDEAFGIADRVPENGRILRNLILGCNYIQSHVLHFYHLTALDYVDVTAVASYEGTDPGLLAAKDFVERGALGPFVPRYEGDYRLPKELAQTLAGHYVQAFDVRRKSHELLAVFGGKMPHNVGIVPGGVTQVPEVDTIAGFLWRLNEIRHFIDHVYVPDVLEVAKHYGDYAEIGAASGKFLDYGVFPQAEGRFLAGGVIGEDLAPSELDVGRITESVTHSWYADGDVPLHPTRGETVPSPGKKGAYSWLKSPRYDGEVGGRTHRRSSRGARSLDPRQRREDRPLPVRRPDDVERFAARREGAAGSDRAGDHRDANPGRGEPVRDRPDRSLVRPVLGVRGAPDHASRPADRADRRELIPMRTAIVGVGNVLMRDEGIGVHVARELMGLPLPAGVEVTDAGTTPDAAFALASADRVIVVDAARFGGSPGTVYRLDADGAAEAEGLRSCHDLGLLQTLRAIASPPPEVLVLGVEPKEIDWGLGLTPDVAASVPRVIEIVKQELKGSQCS
jgi:hydrogenase maturation protease